MDHTILRVGWLPKFFGRSAISVAAAKRPADGGDAHPPCAGFRPKVALYALAKCVRDA